MGKTSIEWTEFAVNPIRATLNGSTGHYCEKISPGCKNCYASRMQGRFGMPQFQETRADGVAHVLDAGKLRDVLSRKKPTTYFWCDMSDMFGDWVPNEWIAACFGVMAATPHHTHQVLTKRAPRLPLFFAWLEEIVKNRPHGRAIDTCAEVCVLHAITACDPVPEHSPLLVGYHSAWPLLNVHLGVSAEDQRRADERIPHLLATPAAVRFVSAEPLLGPLDLGEYLSGEYAPHDWGGAMAEESGPRVDWVIVGGESAPARKARRMEARWALGLREECQRHGVPFFMKQMGTAFAMKQPDWSTAARKDRAGRKMGEWPKSLRVRETP